MGHMIQILWAVMSDVRNGKSFRFSNLYHRITAGPVKGYDAEEIDQPIYSKNA